MMDCTDFSRGLLQSLRSLEMKEGWTHAKAARFHRQGPYTSNDE